MERHPMTPASYRKLAAELDRLKTVERPAISAAIEEARAHGDLRENAEYHAAKDKQGHIEARIRVLETKIALSQVIDPASLSGAVVRFGATVTLLDLDNDEEMTLSIVGEDEADFKKGLLNYASPIARGLFGKEEGEEVSIEAPAGTRNFEILKVVYKAIETT